MATLDIGKSGASGGRFNATVTGGGAYGPGSVSRFTGAAYEWCLILRDNRSGSKRSGYLVYDVSEPGIYRYQGVADSNRSEASGYFERTADGEFVVLSTQQAKARCAALFPAYRARLEAERIAAEAKAAYEASPEALALKQAEAEAELEAQRRRAAARAQELTARKAQAEIDRSELKKAGLKLPPLKGTTKQKAWANDIRATFAKRNPDNPALQEQTSARWWIDHR